MRIHTHWKVILVFLRYENSHFSYTANIGEVLITL